MERFTRADVDRAFASLKVEMHARGVEVALSVRSPGDGITRYQVVESLPNGGERTLFPYFFLGAREAYFAICSTVRLFERINEEDF